MWDQTSGQNELKTTSATSSNRHLLKRGPLMFVISLWRESTPLVALLVMQQICWLIRTPRYLVSISRLPTCIIRIVWTSLIHLLTLHITMIILLDSSWWDKCGHVISVTNKEGFLRHNDLHQTVILDDPEICWGHRFHGWPLACHTANHSPQVGINHSVNSDM